MSMQQEDMLGFSPDSSVLLHVHLDVHAPIDLDQMADAFKGVSYLYAAHIKKSNPDVLNSIDDRALSLYVDSIENNCVLAQLAAFAAPFLGPIEVAKNLADFASTTKMAIDWFAIYRKAGGIGETGAPFNRNDARAIADLTRLAAENKDGALGLEVVEYKATKTTSEFKVKFDSQQARSAHLGASQYLTDLAARGSASHKNVVMQFYQINSDEFKEAGRTGDKAIVNSIFPKPLPVFFSAEIDRHNLESIVRDQDTNPLQLNFLTDVFVESGVQGKPLAYRVMSLHGLMEETE